MTQVMSSLEAQNNFGALLDTAQRVPVLIRRHKRDCAVVLSVQEYEQWQRIKNMRLQEAIAAIQEEVKANGVTPEMVERLLADEL